MPMEQEFEQSPVWRLVLRLGLPAMLAQFFNILYSIVDRIFVGHMASSGGLALAGVGLCAPALTAVTAFSTLIGVGGAAIMSISAGKRERDRARQAISTSFLLLLGISVVVTAVLLAVERPLLYRLGCSDAMYPYAGAYFRTYVLGTPAVLLGTGMNQFVLAQGCAKRGMLSVILGAAVNTILDPIFIYALDMGTRGAALATVLAQVCVMVYVLAFLLGKKAEIPLRLRGFSGAVVGKIFSIGSLPFFIILLDNLLMILLNGTLRKYGGVMGDEYISCAAVVQSFMVLAYYPAQGITTGCATLYGYHYGAGHYEKVMGVFRWVLALCGGFMLLLLVISQTIPEVFARLFMEEETLIPLAAGCIRRYTAGMLGVAVQYALVDGLTAMGQTRYALPVSFFRKGLYILSVLILPLLRPIGDVFWCATIADIVGAAVTLLVFFRKIAPQLKRSLTRQE